MELARMILMNCLSGALHNNQIFSSEMIGAQILMFSQKNVMRNRIKHPFSWRCILLTTKTVKLYKGGQGSVHKMILK